VPLPDPRLLAQPPESLHRAADLAAAVARERAAAAAARERQREQRQLATTVAREVAKILLPHQPETPPPASASSPTATQVDPGPEGWSRPYTVQELARVYGIHRNTMRRRLRERQIRAQQIGRTWQVAVADLPAAERQRQQQR
jgi:excisionase family DNA binding protein